MCKKYLRYTCNVVYFQCLHIRPTDDGGLLWNFDYAKISHVRRWQKIVISVSWIWPDHRTSLNGKTCGMLRHEGYSSRWRGWFMRVVARAAGWCHKPRKTVTVRARGSPDDNGLFYISTRILSANEKPAVRADIRTIGRSVSITSRRRFVTIYIAGLVCFAEENGAGRRNSRRNRRTTRSTIVREATRHASWFRRTGKDVTVDKTIRTSRLGAARETRKFK